MSNFLFDLFEIFILWPLEKVANLFGKDLLPHHSVDSLHESLSRDIHDHAKRAQEEGFEREDQFHQMRLRRMEQEARHKREIAELEARLKAEHSAHPSKPLEPRRIRVVN